MMPLTNKEAGLLIGGALLDAAKELNKQALPRGKRIVAVTTEKGTKFVEVDIEKPKGEACKIQTWTK